MTLRVVLYCPDQHLTYDGRTPDRQGVGGGVTVRIRLARALATLGHRVTLVGNCRREEVVDGVHYLPLQRARSLEADVLLLTTSGGGLDLRPALDLDCPARLRGVWVHGVPRPTGLDAIGFDFVYVPSNFLRGVVQQQWSVPPDRTCVIYHGVAATTGRSLLPWRRPRRDPYRLVYTGHPSKGLEAASGVLRLLRRTDRRFQLHVYGGLRLWGERERPLPPEDGLVYHGLVGQRHLASELERAGFSLNLQAIPEAFGLSLVEALRAGCLVLASPVGAFPELVRHRYNGFLVPGDHLAESTWQRAAELILELQRCSDAAESVRRAARAAARDWGTVARAWAGHWEWALGRHGALGLAEDRRVSCPACGGHCLALADGSHCTACGRYDPAV